MSKHWLVPLLFVSIVLVIVCHAVSASHNRSLNNFRTLTKETSNVELGQAEKGKTQIDTVLFPSNPDTAKANVKPQPEGKSLLGIAYGQLLIPLILAILTFIFTHLIFSEPPVFKIQDENGMSFEIKGKEAKRWWVREKHKRAQQAFNEGLKFFHAGDLDIGFSKLQDAILLKPEYADEIKVLYSEPQPNQIVNQEQWEKIKTLVEVIQRYEKFKKLTIKILIPTLAAFLVAGLAFGIINRCFPQTPVITIQGKNGVTYQLMGTEALRWWKREQEKKSHDEYSIGLIALQNGNYDSASSVFLDAISLNPQYAEAYNNLGYAQFKQNKIDEAMSQYRKAIQLKPDYPDAFNNLGVALIQNGKTKEATASFQQAVLLNGNYAAAYKNLGFAFDKMGITDSAIDKYRTAISLKPDDADAHYSLGNVLIKQIKEKKKKGEPIGEPMGEAIGEFQEASRLSPGFASAYFALTHCYAIEGNMKMAINSFEEAVRKGFDDYTLMIGESDLDTLRNDSLFSRLSDTVMVRDSVKMGSK